MCYPTEYLLHPRPKPVIGNHQAESEILGACCLITLANKTILIKVLIIRYFKILGLLLKGIVSENSLPTKLRALCHFFGDWLCSQIIS